MAQNHREFFLSLEASFLTPDRNVELEETAAAVATPGKGIAACDDGPTTIGCRFARAGIEKYQRKPTEVPPNAL